MVIGTVDKLTRSWLLCRVGRSLCGLPMEAVIETLRPLALEPLADAPPSVLGVSVIRGEPIAVIDLGHLLGHPVVRPQRLVLVRTGPRRVALTTDSVIGAYSCGEDTSRELPPLLQKAAGELVSSLGLLDSELLLFLRSARLMPEGLQDSLSALGGQS